jgi:hypothetical protein
MLRRLESTSRAKSANGGQFLALWAVFLSLGFSQVRFMRYLLPLAPILCLLAAYGASRLPKPRLWGATVALFALWAAKTCCGLSFLLIRVISGCLPQKSIEPARTDGKPLFYTPPFQPQGFNTRVAGIEVTGGRVTKSPFVISEFEWREPLRLGKTEVEAIAMVPIPALQQSSSKIACRLPFLGAISCRTTFFIPIPKRDLLIGKTVVILSSRSLCNEVPLHFSKQQVQRF